MFTARRTWCSNFQGTCEKQIQDIVQRVWNIIENISPDELGTCAPVVTRATASLRGQQPRYQGNREGGAKSDLGQFQRIHGQEERDPSLHRVGEQFEREQVCAQWYQVGGAGVGWGGGWGGLVTML